MMRYLCVAVMLAAMDVTSLQAATIEHLGQPCRANQVLGACVVTDRYDGRERLVLLNDNESYGCELLYIDFEKGAGELYAAPAGAGSWTVLEVPGDRLVVGTFYDGVMMVFDLKAMRFEKVIDFPGESYVWNLVMGRDGRVYGGTYPGAKLGALDLQTWKLEDLGAAVLPNQYLRTVSHAPWGQVFANYMSSTVTTRVYDIPSKKWNDIPGLEQGQTFGVGVEWNGYFVAHDPRTGQVEAFKDASLKPIKERPFPIPDNGGFGVDTVLSDKHTLYLRQGTSVYRYRTGQDEFRLTKVADLDLRGGRFVAATKDGRLLGLRGQCYFVFTPDDRNVDLKRIPVEARGRPSLFLKADDKGRLWGGPHFGQTVFSYDIGSGEAMNTGVVCDGGGEVYDVTFHDGCVYTASYAGGDITRFDPSQPWDQWNRKNPVPVVHIGSRGYIRPHAGIRTGPDGRLYAGWMAKYGTYGGAISITDPGTGQTDLIENPLGIQAIHAFDIDRRHAYVGTSLGANGLPNQEGQAKFGIIELSTRKVTFERAFDCAGIDRVIREPISSTVVFTVNGRLHAYEPGTQTIVDEPIPDLPPISARSIVAVGDGTLVSAIDKRMIRIDLQARTYEVIAESPVSIVLVALASDGRLYFTHEADLYRVVKPLRIHTRKDS